MNYSDRIKYIQYLHYVIEQTNEEPLSLEKWKIQEDEYKLENI